MPVKTTRNESILDACLPITKAPDAQFTLFSLLPTELRLTIWEYAMAEPRLIRVADWISSETSETPDGQRSGIPRLLKIDGDWFQQVPQFFFVNHESRRVALQHYTERLYGSKPKGFEVPLAGVVAAPNDVIFNHGAEYELLYSCSRSSGPVIRNVGFADYHKLGKHLGMLNRYRSKLALVRHKLDLSRQGRHARLKRGAAHLDLLVSQRQTFIDKCLEMVATRCAERRRRQREAHEKLERWVVLLVNDDKFSSGESSRCSDLIFLDRSELSRTFWPRQEDYKHSQNPVRRAAAEEVPKIEFAWIRKWNSVGWWPTSDPFEYFRW